MIKNEEKMLVRKNLKEKIIKHGTIIIDTIILLSFMTVALYWAFNNGVATAPDEVMRQWIPEYIFKHNALPLPDEPEVLAEPFNASYAYYPLLLGAIISAQFMKISSFLGFQENMQLLFASRLTSVISGTIAVFFLIKITKKLFKDDLLTRYFAIIMGSFIPQFIYLSSYVNNDIIAVAASTIMVYAWLLAMESGWNIKRLILLSIGIIICALSYYNAYAWILMSIFIFIITFISINNEEKNKYKLTINYKKMFKNGAIVTVIVLAGISFFFVRNYIVNNGDMLGMKSFLSACEEGGWEEQKPSNREIGKNLGMTYLESITSTRWYGESWIWISFKSFICILGGMSIPISNNYYYFYSILFSIGLIFMLIKVIFIDRKNVKQKLIYFAMFVASIITILLSIQYSYATDYQPQGRYIYPIWLPLILFTSIGINTIFDNLLSKVIKNRKMLNLIKIITYVILCYIFIKVLLVANTALSASAF